MLIFIVIHGGDIFSGVIQHLDLLFKAIANILDAQIAVE